MIAILFLLVMMLAIVFTVMTYANPAGEDFEIVWPFIAFVMWLVAAVSVFNIEWLVSAADTSGSIVTTTVSYTDGWIISPIFLMFAILCILFVVYRVLDRFKRAGR